MSQLLRARHARRGRMRSASEKGEVLLKGVGTLRFVVPPSASVQRQPDGLTIQTNKWFLGAGFLGAPPSSLANERASGAVRLAGQPGLEAHEGPPATDAAVEILRNP